ncbi:CBM96 family carbohydrate-binding protein [Marinicrinis sediminis]|uniref:DNRLRE domain-containing protein n=1 Tax=Marinicrinis sediminis TaxID=1652465 RepID=A0ABW5R9G0_9BACL
MMRRRKRYVSVWLCLLTSLMLAVGWQPNQGEVVASTNAMITLDSPADDAVLSAGTVVISGTYVDTYDINLLIDGRTQASVMMTDPDADHSGTWQYELDTTMYSGPIQLVARGLNIRTRYGVWSPAIDVHVQNPGASQPDVTIASPGDGQTVQGVVDVEVSVASPNSLSEVQVRIGNGSWQTAVFNGNHYVVQWDTTGLQDQTFSIQARATDTLGNTGISLTTYAKIGTGTNEPFSMPSQDRAMWIWEPETYKLLLNPNARTVLDAFASDTTTFGSDPITTLYLAVGPFNGMNILEDDPGKLEDFISWAHQQGYEVHATIAGGTSPPYMGAYAQYHDEAIEEIEGIINYHLAAGVNEKFDGVNVDIEPYISQDFKSQYPALQLQYLDGLQKMIDRIQVAGIHLPFGPAIPKWYDTSPYAANITWNGSTKWLSEHIQDISDYIAIMDYRDQADGSAGIIAGAQGEMNYAISLGKPLSVVVGVETKDIANSGDPEVITFSEEGRTYMESELDKVYTAFDSQSSFGGVAMHHYDSLRALPSYWGTGGVYWEPPADSQSPGALDMNPTATALDHEQIRVTFGVAQDNMEVDRYIVYRSTQSGFTPDAPHVAGLARTHAFTDPGLLPDTTYYYKVAAVDLQGNIGPPTLETSATTAGTTLQPLMLQGMTVSDGNGTATVQMQVVDVLSGQPVSGAEVGGRFNYAGGTYHNGMTDSAGQVSFVSETIPTGYQVGFEPRSVPAAGYYWAQAYDEPHKAALYATAGLQHLEISSGTLSPSFDKNTMGYQVTVDQQTASVQVTPTSSANDQVVEVNGQPTASGSPSAPILLAEGENIIHVDVYGKKGERDRYKLTVTRLFAASHEFVAVADTHVDQNAPSTSFGQAQLLEVVDIPNAIGGGDRLTYMKFDLSAFTESVQSAKLYFHVNAAPSSSLNLTVYSYDTDNWDETMNWHNRLGAGSTIEGTVHVHSSGWHAIDVTTFVQNQMMTDQQVTFRIMDPNTRNIGVQINSSEHPDNQPYIKLNETSAP